MSSEWWGAGRAGLATAREREEEGMAEMGDEPMTPARRAEIADDMNRARLAGHSAAAAAKRPKDDPDYRSPSATIAGLLRLYVKAAEHVPDLLDALARAEAERDQALAAAEQDASGATDCLVMVEEKLAQYIDMKGCPPMFYPEAIHNVVNRIVRATVKVTAARCGQDGIVEEDVQRIWDEVRAALLPPPPPEGAV